MTCVQPATHATGTTIDLQSSTGARESARKSTERQRAATRGEPQSFAPGSGQLRGDARAARGEHPSSHRQRPATFAALGEPLGRALRPGDGPRADTRGAPESSLLPKDSRKPTPRSPEHHKPHHKPLQNPGRFTSPSEGGVCRDVRRVVRATPARTLLRARFGGLSEFCGRAPCVG
jgi:hypothetical protein